MTSLAPTRSFSEILATPFTAVLNAFDGIMHAHRAALEAERLYAMTDSELAAEGLDRATLPAHLMRNLDQQ